MMNMFIHKMLARICDYYDERCENIYSEFIKILFNSERDKYIAKMYRAIKIFIEDHDIDKYNNLFLYKYNVDVKEYINVVYFIIKEFTSMQDRIGSGECNIYEWGISSQDILNKLNIDIDKIDSILRMISLSYDEWILFLANNPSQKERFYFFRDKPLFAIDKNIYIPIDGRFLEELLFDTLRRMYEKLETKSNFSRTFGKSFERYILSLINEFCFYSKQHTYMGEFEYGPEPLRKKSPDGFIISEDGIVVIEVKSSKVFDEVIIGDGNCNCLYKNIYSLFDAPYEQMIHSIKDIEKSCHELIKKEIEKIYIIVTFSNMPLMLIENNDTNKQYISNEKNSFSVMAFEMLLAASEVSGSTCFHILKEYREYPHKITAKNFFTRKFVENDGDYNGKIFQNMSEYSEKFHQDYRRNNSNS